MLRADDGLIIGQGLSGSWLSEMGHHGIGNKNIRADIQIDARIDLGEDLEIQRQKLTHNGELAHISPHSRLELVASTSLAHCTLVSVR